MDHRPKLYATIAFVAGILIGLGFKHLYPDLQPVERRYRRRSGGVKKKTSANGARLKDDRIDLEDYEMHSCDSGGQCQGQGQGQGHQSAADVTEGIEACIGRTPLFKIKSLSEATGCDILAKAEFLNGGGGSPKDRVALNIINTGSHLTILRCMPSDQSIEKSDLLLKLGAVVERVPPAPIVDPMHFVNRARTLARDHTADPNRPGRGYFADQFENQANWQAHFEGTGPELLHQCDSKIHAFVAGAGTGGTIAGVARFLKSKLPYIKIVLADPQGSGLYNRIKHGVMFDLKEKEGTRRRQQVDTIVEGIGINRVTANFEAGRELIDDAVKVDDDQALAMARWLMERDGIFAGSSSAVNCEKGIAAVRTAQKLGPGKRVVTVLCDSGTRHLSKFWAKAGNIGGKSDSELDNIIGSQI
ncbi:MAG: hypothetical protein Q9217_001317 [Psora testacea]